MREIIALGVAEGIYQEVFRSLKRRGLSGVELVVSDKHEDLKAADCRHFQGAAHQRCLLSTTLGTSWGWPAPPSARNSEEFVVELEEAMIMVS